MTIFGRNNRHGFTLVELLVTIAVMTLLVGASVPAYRNFVIKYSLDTNASDLQQLVRTAQNLSMTTRNDDTYGVHVTTGAAGTYTLFKGASYAVRDTTTFDEITYILPSTITLTKTVTGDDVIFTKVVGSTSNTGAVTLTSSEGDVRTVTINAAGMVQRD